MLEFGEFCQMAARFLVEEDEEALKKELKEAFRIYDKEGQLFHFFELFIYRTTLVACIKLKVTLPGILDLFG